MLIPESVHYELLNWARYCWSGPWPHPLPPDHAASAEGKWVPPSDISREEEQESKPAPVDRDSALKVQEAYDFALSGREKPVVRAEYVLRHRFMSRDKRSNLFFDRGRAARSVGYPLHVYEASLVAASRIIGNALGGGHQVRG